MSNSGPVFKGSKIPRDDPRYPTLVRGFNQRWVGEARGVLSSSASFATTSASSAVRWARYSRSWFSPRL